MTSPLIPEFSALPAASRLGPPLYRLHLCHPPPAARGRPADPRSAETRDAALPEGRPAAGAQGRQAGRYGVPGQTAGGREGGGWEGG